MRKKLTISNVIIIVLSLIIIFMICIYIVNRLQNIHKAFAQSSIDAKTSEEFQDTMISIMEKYDITKFEYDIDDFFIHLRGDQEISMIATQITNEIFDILKKYKYNFRVIFDLNDNYIILSNQY